MTTETSGEVSEATPPTFREQAKEFAFRNAAVKKAAGAEVRSRDADCSIPAAVVLSYLAMFGDIDQMEMRGLKAYCEDEISLEELTIACEELESMHAVQFYFDEEREEYFIKSLNPTGLQIRVDTSDAVRGFDKSYLETRRNVFEAADNESCVFEFEMISLLDRASPERRDQVMQDVQRMIDADEVCIALNEEDYMAFYRRDALGEEYDGPYFGAAEAFSKSRKRWNTIQGEKTEPEVELLKVCQRIAIGNTVRINELARALPVPGWSLETAWTVIERLSNRGELGFEKSIPGEIYIRLENSTSVWIRRHKSALPVVREMLIESLNATN